jgi:hypothetical protein
MRTPYSPLVPRRKPTERALRRARSRTHATLVRDLERLAQLAPGGSPGRPIDIASPAQLEPIALATACPLCNGSLRLEEHVAETVDGVRLRVAAVNCVQCGVRRRLYFRLAPANAV